MRDEKGGPIFFGGLVGWLRRRRTNFKFCRTQLCVLVSVNQPTGEYVAFRSRMNGGS